MSDTNLTEPIVLDETGQLMLDKLDAIISALNPNAQGVSFDKTGCEIITANNVQGALTQLDSGLDDTNTNLATKSESVSTQYSDENIVFVKSGNCCQIYVNGIKNIPASSGTELCTIPSGYYPKFQDLIKWGLYDNSLTPIVRFYTNSTRDKLYIYNYTSSSLTKANFHVNIDYIS